MRTRLSTSGRKAGRRTLLLGSTSALVIAAMATGPLHAADGVITSTPPSPTGPLVAVTSGQVVGGTSQVNVSGVTGSVQGGAADLVANTVTSGAVAGSNTVGVNAFTASATGNAQTTVSDTLGTSALGDGLAIVATQVNVSAAEGIAVLGSTIPPAITSSVADSSISATLNDFEIGSATVDGNTISARTTGNTNTTTVSGVAPFDGSATSGTASATASGTNATATVVVSTMNLNVDVGAGFGSFARVEDNDITLLMQEDAAGVGLTITGSAVVEDNEVSSTFTGNAATNGVNVETTSNPTFEGSIALTNVSRNLVGGDPVAIASLNSGSTVRGEIANGGGGAVTLQGALSVSGNAISSAATGNQSGNAITVEDGQSIDGNAQPGSGSNAASSSSSSVDGRADLLLINSQSNEGDDLDAMANVIAATDGGSITSSVANIDGGSVSMSGDRISSSATGSSADNTIDAGGSSTNSIAATASITNLQVNSFAESKAGLGDNDGAPNQISATVGVEGPQNGASITDASASIDAASMAVTAGGNDAANTLSLAATTIAPGAAPAGAALTIDRGTADAVVSDAAAAASINSNQRLSNDSDVQAENRNSTIEIDATGISGSVAGSSFGISGGSSAAIGATAIGNGVENALTLVGTNVAGQTAGILNAQTVGAEDDFSDNDVNSVVADPSVSIAIGNDVAAAGMTDSSAEIGGNLVQAFTAGNQGTNVLDVSGLSSIVFPAFGAVASDLAFDLDAVSGLAFDDTDAARVQGAFAILSSQANSGSNLAEIAGDGELVQVTVGGSDNSLAPGNISDSSVTIAGNRLMATSLANQIDNTLTLSGNSISPSAGYSPIAGITSIQEVGIGGSSAAEVNGDSQGTLLAITAGNDVFGSTVAIDGNLVQALSAGNYASGNVLTVTANELASGVSSLDGLTISGATGSAASGGAQADLPLTVVNAQSIAFGSAITAGVNTDAGALFGSGAVIEVRGDEVVGSTLSIADNAFIASATDNNALMNAVQVRGVNDLTVGAGVQNMQVTAADAAATLGTQGTPAVAGTPPVDFGTLSYDVANGNNSATINGNSLQIVGNPMVIDTSGLTQDQVTALQTFFGGGTVGAGTLTLPAGTYTVTDGTQVPNNNGTVYLSSGGGLVDQPLQLSTPGTPGIPATPGAMTQIIAVNDPITNSTLSITADAGTRASGAYATSNNAVNVLDVSANTIGSGGVAGSGGLSGAPEATVLSLAGTLLAEGDFAVQNGQFVYNDGSIAQAFETIGIASFDPALTPSAYGITGSTLLIDGNRLQAFSQGNIASNALSLELTNTGDTPPSAALVSGQYVDIIGAQTALSELQVYAPAVIGGLGAGEGSSSTVSRNTNTALSVQNDVSNAVAVTGTNVGGDGNGHANRNSGGVTVSAQGAFSLTSVQDARGAGNTATATTDIFNYDNLLQSSSGIANSTLRFVDNATVAEAGVNRANANGGNRLTIEADNLEAGGALVNAQTNADSPSTANATSNVSLAVIGGAGLPPGVAATGSSLELGGNTTTATSRGNLAINAFSATATNHGAGTTLETAQARLLDMESMNVEASGSDPAATNHALTNGQVNGGAISATAAGQARVSLAADPDELTQTVLNSSVLLEGNNVRSEANGNVAGNTMSVGGTNLSAAAALASGQDNSAAITSTATSTVSLVAGGGDAGTAAAQGSALNVIGNETVAVGRGNSATNALNATPVASYGTGAAGASATVVGNASATAGFALLNAQRNSGDVTVAATASYTTTLNSDAGASASVFGSGARVAGNQAVAVAYGNSGSNTMTVAALNSAPATTALTSTQVNSGNIGAATVGTNTLTVGSVGVSGSSLGVTGNGIAAAAFGNSVANAIVSR